MRRSESRRLLLSSGWPCSSTSSAVLFHLLPLILLLLPPRSLVSGLTTDGVFLLAFKYSVLSDPLYVLSGWNYDDATPCSWNGVVCTGIPGSDTSRVIGLVLPNAQLLGSVPPDLGLVEHLRHLDLSGNFLNGTLPATLFNASELRVLSLANNEISGELPELVGSLRSLQLLNLSDNALTGRVPDNLSLLPNLTVVSLSGNYLYGSLSGGLEQVEFLDLSSNLVNGTLPPEIGGISLRYLNLSYNRLSGEIPPNFGSRIPANATIDLSFNNLTGAIPDSDVFLYQKPRSYAGNPDLCGKALKNLCPIPSTLSDPPPNNTMPETPGMSDSPPAFAAIPKTMDGGSQARGGQQAQSGLRPGTIAGIVVGDLAGIGLLFMVFLFVYQAKKKKAQQQQQQQQGQSGRGVVGLHKADNGGELKWVSSASSEPSGRRLGGLALCLGKTAGRGNDSEETSETTGSDTDDGAREEGRNNILDANHQHQEKQKKGGLLVTVDGETELELETLLKASAYILGATGSSIVYKAVLADGSAFAVRRIGENTTIDKLKDFDGQVRSIAKLRHPNIVRLRGFYWGSDEKLLIYDYSPNGSLANISYKKLGSSPYHMPWEARLRIARGVARGLAFLHEKKCVHGNLKPSNILLDSDMEPRIGDVGLERLMSGDNSNKPGVSARHFGSKRSTLSLSSLQEPSSAAASPAGSSTTPYHAPESLQNLKPNTKWDVYSFGMVLLELLTGRIVSESELLQWNAGFIVEERNRILRMADAAMRSEVEGKEEALLSCFKLGFSCASLVLQRRPSMKDALQVLDKLPSSSSPASAS